MKTTILLAAVLLLMAPSAVALTIQVNPTAPSSGTAVAFTADSGAATTWTFDDGTQSVTGASVQHTFNYAGVYYVTATASGNTATKRIVVGYPTASLVDGNSTSNSTTSQAPAAGEEGEGGGGGISGPLLGVIVMGGAGGILGLYSVGRKWREKQRANIVSGDYDDEEEAPAAKPKAEPKAKVEKITALDYLTGKAATKAKQQAEAGKASPADGEEPQGVSEQEDEPAPASKRKLSIIDDEDEAPTGEEPVRAPPVRPEPARMEPAQARELAAAAKTATSFSGPTGPAIDIQDLNDSPDQPQTSIEDEPARDQSEPKRARANLSGLSLADGPLETVDPAQSGKGME